MQDVTMPDSLLLSLFTNIGKQMNWRLNEGKGECMYMLGYADDGRATGVLPWELKSSIKTLKVMTAAVGAKITNMQVREKRRLDNCQHVFRHD